MPMPCSDHAVHLKATESRRPVGYLSAFDFFRLARGLSRRTRHCWCMAGTRHGMCELTAQHGKETAWARIAVCESALTCHKNLYFIYAEVGTWNRPHTTWTKHSAIVCIRVCVVLQTASLLRKFSYCNNTLPTPLCGVPH
jgi:hypothetical protein